MAEPLHVNLHPSEQAITLAASHIYAAYVVSGFAKEDPDEAMKKAVATAIQLARSVDDNVIAPGEMS